jgi:hypothetical protein
MRDRRGREVVHLWACARPDAARPAKGYPVPDGVATVTLFSPTREQGAYNHHPKLAAHEGRFFAAWSNQPCGEDGPGQRVLHCASDDGRRWTAPAELFPPPGPVGGWHDRGLAHTACKWLVHEGELYAVACLHANVGFTDFDHTLPPVPRRDRDHPSRARKGYSPVARRVRADGTCGPIFPLFDNLPDDLAYRPAVRAGPAEQLGRMIRSPEHLVNWDFEGRCRFPDAYDGHRLCEPATFPDADGRWVLLARDTRYSHRMYTSHWDPAANAWTAGEPTDIPDTPSLAKALRRADGTVLLIGNQAAPAFDNWDQVTHYPRDPLTVSASADGKTFTRVYALRHGAHDWNVPQGEIGGRGPGYQYPDAVVSAGRLWVVHSVGKERIAVCFVPVADVAS